VILLVDMDAFFASVEQAHHPHLRGQPVIVCGDPSRRGVVTAASYEARPSGVHAGMSLADARRLCPDAHYVEGNPEKYVSLSLKLLDLYLERTPDVEPFSVDEAFLRVGRPGDSLASAAEFAADLQREIEARHGLTASIGVGPNKLIAKMAAGVRKPRGLTALDEAGFCRQFWSCDVQDLWGVGPKLAVRMRSLGILTVGELARAPEHVLRGAFGIIGPQLKQAASGQDDSRLVPYYDGVDPKSMGHEVTLTADSADPEFLTGTLLRLSDQVGRRLRGEGFVGRTVTLKLRDHTFATRLRQRSLAEPTDDHRQIFAAAHELWRELWTGDQVRLLGVTVSMLSRAPRSGQVELFERDRRTRDWQTALDRVRDRLGEASLVPAATLTHLGSPCHVPFGSISARSVEAED
jgi:DNA polymerase-4